MAQGDRFRRLRDFCLSDTPKRQSLYGTVCRARSPAHTFSLSSGCVADAAASSSNGRRALDVRFVERPLS